MAEQNESLVVFSLNGVKQILNSQKVITDDDGNTYVIVMFSNMEGTSDKYLKIGIVDLLTILLKAAKDSALNNELIDEINETLSGVEKMIKVVNAKFSAAINAFKDTKID